MNKKVYKIVMMNKDEIKIDAEEIPKIIKAISSASPAILKQGIFNPSSYSHIIEDNRRKIVEKLTNESGQYTGEIKMHYEELPDIFADIKKITLLKTANK